MIKLSKNQDLKNKFKIFSIVKDHFSLTQESLNLFKYRLFQEPLIAKEYKDIIGDSKDLRKRVPLDEKLFESFDEGWKAFQNRFVHFINSHKINYKNFRNNKIIINKQEVKLKKAILSYYIENINYAINDLENFTGTFLGLVKTPIGKCLLKVEKKKAFICKDCEHKCSIGKFSEYPIQTFSANRIEREKVENITSSAKETIDASITKSLEYIGTKKIPSGGLQVVFSLNFTDWFLCSGAERWSSCISVDSTYERAFWSGLPSLVGDKNRAMIYVTDGIEKEYNGVIVDRIISRSWVTLIRSKDAKTKNKTFFTMVREYPSYLGLAKIAGNALNLKFYGDEEDRHPENYVGRYYIELLWHKVKEGEFLNSIYFDNLAIKIANKNIAEHFRPGTYGRYVRGCGSSSFLRNEKGAHYTDKGFNYSGGLSRIVNKKIWKSSTKRIAIKSISYFYENDETGYYDENDGFTDGDDDYEEDF